MAWTENIIYREPGFELKVDRWDFPDEGVSCVWGKSGSGKTTLLQILAGLLKSPGFKLSVQGQLISELTLGARNVGFVFQDFALFPHMTVAENMAFAGEARGLDKSLTAERVAELARSLGLEAILNRKASVLSGGEQQRVALGRALVTKPTMICLDEPFSALDERLRDDARSLVKALAAQYRVPFLLVTHDLRDVRALAREVLLLDQGQVVASGAVDQILNRPSSLQAAKLIPENQIVEVAHLPPTWKKKFSQAHQLVLKPWSFEVAKSPSEASAAGFIEKITDEGFGQTCQAKLGDGLHLKVLVVGESLKAGDKVNLVLRENFCFAL